MKGGRFKFLMLRRSMRTCRGLPLASLQTFTSTLHSTTLMLQVRSLSKRQKYDFAQRAA